MEWQPIKTAPMYTDLLLYWRADLPMDVGLRCETGWQRANDGMDEYDQEPTFWTWLPAPPNSNSTER